MPRLFEGTLRRWRHLLPWLLEIALRLRLHLLPWLLEVALWLRTIKIALGLHLLRTIKIPLWLWLRLLLRGLLESRLLARLLEGTRLLLRPHFLRTGIPVATLRRGLRRRLIHTPVRSDHTGIPTRLSLIESSVIDRAITPNTGVVPDLCCARTFIPRGTVYLKRACVGTCTEASCIAGCIAADRTLGLTKLTRPHIRRRTIRCHTRAIDVEVIATHSRTARIIAVIYRQWAHIPTDRTLQIVAARTT